MFMAFYNSDDGFMFKKTYFSRQAVHERGEILVEDRGVQPIEQIVALLLVLHEQLDVLVYPLVHGNRVLIPTMRMYTVQSGTENLAGTKVAHNTPIYF